MNMNQGYINCKNCNENRLISITLRAPYSKNDYKLFIRKLANKHPIVSKYIYGLYYKHLIIVI